VGPSGGGKTSIVNLIPRLYDPSVGYILLDNTDLREYTLKSLRSQISVVSQDPVLINDNLLKNIAYGQQTIDFDRVTKALKLADLQAFVDQLPEGLETNVGNRGSKLSGGQKQRIAIARAAYRDAPILILDEATSALDQITEKRVQDALEELRAGRTTIDIAHRLSTIASLPRIVVIDQGRLIAEGSHETLLKDCVLYQQIVNQMRSTEELS
jgi:subfamily B ATP-binding cassette protein MsbA